MNNELPQSVKSLCAKLGGKSGELDRQAAWPGEQLNWCAEAGVFKWFIPSEYGGLGWDESQILHGYLALSRSCLTTTFVLTQWHAACKRILSGDNDQLKQELLPQLATGEIFATVGISHLTTSRQHLAKPVLAAQPLEDGGFRLDGYSPWVTGGAHADVIVTGAILPDHTQVIVALRAASAGLKAKAGTALVALSSSCTDEVLVDSTYVPRRDLIAGPTKDVLQSGAGGGAGGLQTSTLAVGLAGAAASFLSDRSERRSELRPVADKIASDCRTLELNLEELTCGRDSELTVSELRQQANSLVLRSTQAALSAAKGAGFVASHPAGRWAREALFFLVWSCPQPVVAANLCELAQLTEN